MSYGSISQPEGPVEAWPIVTSDGVEWYVAPVYVAPVARKDLLSICDAWGCEVPTKNLVDDIWRAADLRLDPSRLMRWPNDIPNGRSEEAYAKQKRAIEARIGGQDFTLLAGSHKDFVAIGTRYDLYGWHLLTGALVEKGATSHDEHYVDYSQGLRLVRRVVQPRPHHCVQELP